ncbi:hypothetical protein U0070_017415, partial [Myodes glareolus]
MVKFLLLALAFGLANAHAQLEGKWFTTAIAADNADTIEEGGPLRLYARELACIEACNKLEITFYIKANDQCTKTKVVANRQADGKYRSQCKYGIWELSLNKSIVVEGDNIFSPVYATPEFIIFSCHNVNRTGRTTNLIYA